MAGLLGGAYICGASDHWRKKERASGRDLFLSFQGAETKSEDHRNFCRDHAKGWIGLACQRNKAVEFNTCGLVTRKVPVRMSAATEKIILACVETNSGGQAHELRPEAHFFETPTLYEAVVNVAAAAENRKAALVRLVSSILDGGELRGEIIPTLTQPPSALYQKTFNENDEEVEVPVEFCGTPADYSESAALHSHGLKSHLSLRCSAIARQVPYPSGHQGTEAPNQVQERKDQQRRIEKSSNRESAEGHHALSETNWAEAPGAQVTRGQNAPRRRGGDRGVRLRGGGGEC